MKPLEDARVVERLRLESRLVHRLDLGPEREAMFTLLQGHFIGVTREGFANDLAEKDWVILLEDHSGVLQGFSTLAFYASQFRGETFNVACSGDTIVRPRAWGSPALPRAWIGAIDELRARNPERRTLWLLLASGFRTYRFLPVFWQRFSPCVERATPALTQELLEHLALERFGDAYDRDTGIVRFAQPQSLRGPLRELPRERLSDPHVAFFVERNPGHARGDEIVCLADLGDENLTARGRRVLESARRLAGRRREKRA